MAKAAMKTKASVVPMARREGVLDGRLFAAKGVSLKPAAPATRLVLRVRQGALAEAKKHLGFALPTKPKSSVIKDDVHCLWIGPDEWLVIAPESSDLQVKFAKVGNSKLSAVEVSHRNTAILIEGAKAADALNSGCPQDLSPEAFPVGAASRTLLGKSEIILYRTGETAFRVECWRSFADYAWTFLEDAVRSA